MISYTQVILKIVVNIIFNEVGLHRSLIPGWNVKTVTTEGMG